MVKATVSRCWGVLSQLLTGDSPLAADNLGILAADVLLKAAAE